MHKRDPGTLVRVPTALDLKCAADPWPLVPYMLINSRKYAVMKIGDCSYIK